MQSKTYRIAKNTFILYLRQILVMLVNLYTIRIILNTLGVEDYGIYTVMAGVVSLCGLLSGTMLYTSQRYISFAIGKSDFEQLQKVFSLILTICVLVIFITLLLAETIGFWFINNKMKIPSERRIVGLMVYQFLTISFLFTILTVPCMAATIAHEDMDLYAYLSLIETISKLGIVLLLQFIRIDKLQLFAILSCIHSAINSLVCIMIFRIKFKKYRFFFYWNNTLFKEIASYTGWSLLGVLYPISRNQGITILLNQYYGSIIAGARNMAMAIYQIVGSFADNLNTAIRPQLIKNYAVDQYEKAINLMFWGTKFTYFFLYIIILPLILEIPIILSIWLTNTPEYMVLFVRLVLIDVFMTSITGPAVALFLAGRNIGLYQSIVSALVILTLPISWIVLMFGAPPYSVMVVQVFFTCLGFIVRLFLLKRFIQVSLFQYTQKIILPIFIVSILAAILPILLFVVLEQGLLRLCLVTFIGIISSSVCMYFFGLNMQERFIVKNIIVRRLPWFPIR